MTEAQVTGLLERALRAEITDADLPGVWPAVPSDPYLAEVRDDLEFAVEHIPGERWKRPWRPDLKAWRRHPQYHDIEIHLERLRERAGR